MWQKGNSGQFQSSDNSGDKIGSDMDVTSSVFDELARHVALLVNVLDLNHVFLGGLPEDLTEKLAGKIRAEIKENWPYTLPINCEVTPASLGNKAVAYGAAGHCLQRFFSLPNISQPSGNGPSIKETLSAIKDI